MLLVIPVCFFAVLVPVFCVYLLAREDAHPTMKALAIVVLSPYALVIVRILRNVL